MAEESAAPAAAADTPAAPALEAAPAPGLEPGSPDSAARERPPAGRHHRGWMMRMLSRVLWLELAALALILAVGAYFRLVGLDWDQMQHLHPDERFLTMVEGGIRTGVAAPVREGSPHVDPASLVSTYFDTARSALNPQNVGFGFYVYGTFPLFAVHWIAAQLHQLDYGKVHLLGRQLSAYSDLVTVALTYLVARRLYDWRVALLAAALVSACVMHIQQAHFFVFDSFLVTLVVACFYFCVDIAQTGRLPSYALAGLFLGLALATKLSMLVLAPIIALAAVIYLWRTFLSGRGLSKQAFGELWQGSALWNAIAGGIIALFVAGLAFRILQPYAFAGPGFFDLHLSTRWLDNISQQSKYQSGVADSPPNIQWAGTEPLLFPWRHMVAWGMGIPLGLVSWAGFAAALAVVAWKGRWQHLLVLSWAAICFVYFATVLNKTMRYVFPAYPFFIILGAWALVAFYDWTLLRRDAARVAAALAARRRRSFLWQTAATQEGVEPLDPLEELSHVKAPIPLWARLAPPLALTLIVATVISSVAWSYAFTRIYTRPVTRVAASEWIYANVPPGSKMANEHWDDAIPVNLPDHPSAPYAGPQLPLYDGDDAKKLDTIVQLLTQSDYINITSNRLYRSIPRIPQRYPMTTEYYRRLFAGDLGFSLVATFASYPTLGPWVIDDDRAEEAFTVYDHPKVLIFKKQPDFSPDKVRQILGAVPLDNVVPLLPIQVGKPDLMLTPSLRAADTAGGTWSEMFNPSAIENALAPILWWLVVEALGLLAAPLLWALLPRLPDRGYGLAKALGLLGVSWLAWLLASYRLLKWTRLDVLVGAAALAVLSSLLLRRRGLAWLAWARAHRRLLLTSEAVFLFAFLLSLFFRAMNPDLWHPYHGGEKPMEFSYLNAVIKTTYFPPYDPWFAGGYLNYYYFGYVLLAALTKLTGVMPEIAFNVAVPILYALLAAGSFSFAYNLSRLGGRKGFGLRAALFAGVAGYVLVALVGNLDGFAQLVERLARVGDVATRSSVPIVSGLLSLLTGLPAVILRGSRLPEFDYWRSSRVIPNNTINEFPFWTFLFADLHAHLISLPYQVTTLGVILHLTFGGRQPRPAGEDDPLSRGPGPEGPLRWALSVFGWRRLGEVLLVGWLVGSLYVINTWEFPTYVLLAAGAFLIAEWTAQGGLTLGGLTRAVLSAGGVFVVAKPLYQPFWKFYLTFYSSVTPWTEDKSRLDHYLIIHGLFVFMLATFVGLLGFSVWKRTGWGRYLEARWRWLGAWERFSELEYAFNLRRREPASGYLLLLMGTVLLALVLVAGGLTLMAFLFVLLAAIAAVAWERRDSPALLFACLLAGTGCALSLFVEVFTLQGDIGRMNTVFKFYLQLWVMWALVSAVTLGWMVDRFLAGRHVPSFSLTSRPLAAGPLLYESPAATGYGDGDAADWSASSATAPAYYPARTAPAAETAEQIAAPTQSGTSGWMWAWLAAAGALILAALTFTFGGTPARLAERFNPLAPTLDGMAYMPYATIVDGNDEVKRVLGHDATIHGAADYAAIRWLQQNVTGSPVVLEASIPEYRWGARVAKYTGLPAVLGWRWHQVQQRGTYGPLVDQRLRDVGIMFGDPSPSRVLPLLEKYHVRYIYVGDLERAYYAGQGLAKFDQMTDHLKPVYQQDGVTIYEVLPTSPAA